MKRTLCSKNIAGRSERLPFGADPSRGLKSRLVHQLSAGSSRKCRSSSFSTSCGQEAQALRPYMTAMERDVANEVGRGEGQGYFACGAGGRGFDSHLVHQLGASSSVDRAPMSLAVCSRPAVTREARTQASEFLRTWGRSRLRPYMISPRGDGRADSSREKRPMRESSSPCPE